MTSKKNIEKINIDEDVLFDNNISQLLLSLDNKIRSGEFKKIAELVPGDQITSHDSYKTVIQVHHKKEKECVEITLKSGKKIIVSEDHTFPTNIGRLCVNDGLSVGLKLNVVV